MSALPQVRVPREAVSKGSPAKKPRILYLITRAERGGAQMHLLDLASGMKDEFEVQLATGEEGFLTQACRQMGIAVYVLPHLEREIRPLPDILATHELLRLMRAVRPDIVHAHTFKAGFLGRFAAKLLKIPAVYTVHMWPFGRAVPLAWRLVAPVCERLAARWCEKIISVSTVGVRAAAEFKIGEKKQLIPILNGIADHPSRARLDRENELSCTMVARFTAFKDHSLLLRAFAQVPGPVRLKLVGDGETLEASRKLAEDLKIDGRVDFQGSRADVPELLAQTDIFVLASKTETLPISILEAMRAGLPVIASDVGGVCEEVIHGETGILVESGSVDALAAALQLMFTDKALRLRMGKCGRQRFEESFRSDKMIRKTEAVYRDVLAAGAGRW